MKLPRIIRDELAKIPGRWVIEDGARHKHLVIDGKLVAVIRRARREGDARGYLNMRANIRRYIEGRA